MLQILIESNYSGLSNKIGQTKLQIKPGEPNFTGLEVAWGKMRVGAKGTGVSKPHKTAPFNVNLS